MVRSVPISTPWFVRTRVDSSLTLLVEPHVHRMLRCNVWHVRGRRRNLVVDTGLGVTSLRAAAEDLFGDDVLAVATHAHVDHVGGLHEFDQRAIHVAEAVAVARGGPPLDLDFEHADPARVEQLATWGYDVRGGLLTALPRDDLDVGNVPRHPAPCTQLLHEGDVIDLGDRAFEVLHLPGHSPGSIGLWDEHNAVLFSGDAVYDGPLLDEIEGADIDAYIATMMRLRDLPVEVVHAGHDPSMDRRRFIEIIDTYLEHRSQ